MELIVKYPTAKVVESFHNFNLRYKWVQPSLLLRYTKVDYEQTVFYISY